MATFPAGIFAPPTRTNGTPIEAAYVNDLQDEVVAIETALGAGSNAWASYTPTLTASVTNPTIGDGTLSGRYCRIMDVVFFNISWTFGSTSAAGDGSYSFALPVTALDTTSRAFAARLTDTGSRYYDLSGFIATTSTVQIAQVMDNNLGGVVTHNSPITWAAGDVLVVSGFYEAA